MFSYIVAASCFVLFGTVHVALSTAENVESLDREERAIDEKDVIKLSDKNFKDLVLRGDESWLVEFYAPWCGYCKKLAPHWALAATELKGKMKLGALDATVHSITADKYEIRGYPTIKYFPAGKKVSEPQEYDGGQSAAEIVQWAKAKLA